MVHDVWLLTQVRFWANVFLVYAESSTVRLKQGHHVCWTQGTGEGKIHCSLQHGGSSRQLGIKLLGGHRNGIEHMPKVESRHRSAYPKKPLELVATLLGFSCFQPPAGHEDRDRRTTLTLSGSYSACAWVRVK